MTVLVFALLFAMLSPIVRACNSEWQTFFLVYGAVMLGAMGLVTLVMCRGRYRLERQAGPLLLRTDAKPDRRMRLKQGIWVGVWLALIVSQWWLAAAAHSEPEGDELAVAMGSGWWGILLIPHALTKIWWGTGVSTIEICENGLVMAGSRFVVWTALREDLSRFYWSSFTPNKLVVVHRFRTWHIEVAAKDRVAVERLFAAHLGKPPAMVTS